MNFEDCLKQGEIEELNTPLAQSMFLILVRTTQTDGRVNLLAEILLNYFAGLTVSQTVSSVTLLDMCTIPKLKEKKKGL